MHSKARIVESSQVQQNLRMAPVEILRAYEIWARLVEEHGSRILWEFKGYRDEKLSGQRPGASGRGFDLRGLTGHGE